MRSEWEARLREKSSEMELTALGCDTCESFKLNKGSGCENCNHTGYKGRIAVQEVLEITPVLQKVIIQGAYLAGACLTVISMLYFNLKVAPHYHRHKVR